jgi:hypothetical protein
LRGEHTEEVLLEVCGYPRERVRELGEAGVLGAGAYSVSSAARSASAAE